MTEYHWPLPTLSYPITERPDGVTITTADGVTRRLLDADGAPLRAGDIIAPQMIRIGDDYRVESGNRKMRRTRRARR